MSNIIFYFSGTGNSYSIAKGIQKEIGDTIVVPLLKAEDYKAAEYNIVGFIVPVYYLHVPEIALKAIKRISLRKDQQVFAVADYGGTLGYALQDIREALADEDVILQEYKIRMPGNYILEYGAFPKAYQEKILKKAQIQISKIAGSILENKSTGYIEPNLIAKLFHSRSKKQMSLFGEIGSELYTKEQCVHCYQCVKLCPTKNITIGEGNLIWGSKCVQCMACIQWCPQKAVSHPLMKKNRRYYTNPNVVVNQSGEFEFK
ncbi:MAG: EFR1 family ferrodoxin [Acetivibrionales bacterium]|jgi:ferredoxin|nr:hypothetical protein [Clostridiaceae bacterium]